MNDTLREEIVSILKKPAGFKVWHEYYADQINELVNLIEARERELGEEIKAKYFPDASPGSVIGYDAESDKRELTRLFNIEEKQFKKDIDDLLAARWGEELIDLVEQEKRRIGMALPEMIEEALDHPNQGE